MEIEQPPYSTLTPSSLQLGHEGQEKLVEADVLLNRAMHSLA